VVNWPKRREANVKVGLASDDVTVSQFWPIWWVVARLSRAANEPVAPQQTVFTGAYLTCDESRRGLLEHGKPPILQC
jgi:hypothetical protein